MRTVLPFLYVVLQAVQVVQSTTEPFYVNQAPQSQSRQLQSARDYESYVYMKNTRAVPFRWVGRLRFCFGKGCSYTSSAGGDCTATLIGPRHIISAASCLYDNFSRRFVEPKNYLFYPGMQDDNAPYGAFRIKRSSLMQQFLEFPLYTKDAMPWDIAVHELEQPIGARLGHFQWGHLRGNQRLNLRLAGYPCRKSSQCPNGVQAAPHTMWRSGCHHTALSFDSSPGKSLFRHHCDATYGEAGGAMYTYIPRDRAKCPTDMECPRGIPAGFHLAGIHISEDPLSVRYNRKVGVLLSDSVVTFLKQAMAQ